MSIKCFNDAVKVLCHCSVLVCTAMSLQGSRAEARVARLETTLREVVGDGMSFGDTGPYEKLRGTAFFEVDPDDPHNAAVFDLDKAPRNKQGMVEFSADFFILRPVDLTKGNSGLFFETPNRGRKISFRRMHDTVPSANLDNPTSATDFGNGFLLRRGYTLAWVGWEVDIPGGPSSMTARLPIALDKGGQPISERIAIEFSDAKGARTADVFTLPLAATGPTPVPGPPFESVSTDQVEAMAELLVRPSQSPRPSSPDLPEAEVIPSSRWSFARCPDGPPGTPSVTDICLAEAFQNDKVYQLNFKATKTPITGLGYVTTRDFISFLRHARDGGGNSNPVSGISIVLCQGGSQTGQYLRDFLYEGFNEDEQGQRVCDGMQITVQGTPKLALNYRFAQVNAGTLQHATRLRPDTNFPRTYAVRENPLPPRQRDGILKRPATDPKVIQTTSSSEYWQFRASLLDTDEDGTVDLIQPDNVRRYLFSGTQHRLAAPGHELGDRQCQQFTNPNQGGALDRAVFVALDRWVREGIEPPTSRVPRIDDGTLIDPDQYCKQFPNIPGVTCNGLYNGSGERYFGPRVMENRGVVDNLIPDVLSVHQVLVPRVDAIGNDIAGIRHPFVQAPVATLTGWNLRTPEFTDGDLCDLSGMMVCLQRTQADRLAVGDPRPSLEELYGDHASYVSAVAEAALDLWAQRLMLLEDVFQTIREADQTDEREACWQYMR